MENIEKRAKIALKMETIGDHFAEKLMANGVSAKSAQIYFNIVDKAYKASIDDRSDAAILIEFASQLTERLVRTEAYQMYVEHCVDRGVEPQGRNKFYKRMRVLDFKDGKAQGGTRMLVPPKAITASVV